MTLDEVIEKLKYDFEIDMYIHDIAPQLAEWLEELKALRILLDWAIECGFGLDSFPDEYEQYKHTLTDDMNYTEMVKKIAKCVVEEQLKEGGNNV